MHTRAQELFAKLDRQATVRASTRKLLLGFSTITHIVSRFRKLFPQLGAYATAQQERAATSARLSQLFTNTYYAFEQLEKADPKAAELVGQLMSYTEFEIDPQKSWDKHGWLHESANKVALQRLVGEANQAYHRLRQMRRAAVYTNFRAVNEALHYAMMSVSLHNLVASDPTVAQHQLDGFAVDPTDAFRAQSALHESPERARDYWRAILARQTASVEQYLHIQRQTADTATPTAKAQIVRHISPLSMRVQSINESIAAMDQAPYFHLGRFGEQFVAFTIRLADASKHVDPAAIEQVAARFAQAGFTGVQISRDSLKPNVFLTLETIEQMEQAYQLARTLQREGWVAPDKEILRGLRHEERPVTQIAPEFLTRYIESLEASQQFEPTEDMSDEQKAQLRKNKDAMIANARAMWLDMLPDTALSKVMVHRNAVPGYSKDMIRNFAFRMQVGVNALANLSASAKITRAFTEMRTAVNAAKSDASVDVVAMQDIFGEISRREAERPLRTGRSLIDTWRAVNHAFFLGMSPSYVLVNLTQVGVLLWPELAKRHGFVKAAQAIARATPLAFRVMQSTLQSGVALGAKRAADAIITEASLTASGIPIPMAEFLMRVVNTGNIDIGSASRELGRVADAKMDSKTDMALRYAAAFGYYSETFTRLIAALAARDLHGEAAGLDQYVGDTVNESMLNYSTWNTSRMTGKLGLAGQFSPVMFSFMQYQFQVIEKLYREVAMAFDARAATPAERSESRRFLKGHLAAMLVLAGSLGLPMASVLARVAEKAVDWWDDDEEPFDAEAAWRNMLADMFGPDVGEMLSRGVLRGVGVDVATRVGEQDILPFTRLLTDRRKWQDASKDWALQVMGSPVSMLSSIVQGGVQIGDGDVLSGMKSMVPVAIKGPLEAFRMSEHGYVDASGNRLPMSAGAGNILAQAVGFTPAEKAEYSEAKMAQTVRKGDLVQRASVLRRQLAMAVERQDTTAFQETLQEARAFDRSNPAYAVLAGLPEVIQRRARARAMAAQTSNPLGTNRKDQNAQRLTQYANF